MADIFDKTKRSEIMGKVRSNGNKSTELKFISFLNECHIKGWKRNYSVIGHPDFVFMNERIAVFIDGCFWHGHNCRNLSPSENSSYWQKKIEYNKKHDKIITDRFKARGWTVIRIWECDLRKKNREKLIEKIKSYGLLRE